MFRESKVLCKRGGGGGGGGGGRTVLNDLSGKRGFNAIKMDKACYRKCHWSGKRQTPRFTTCAHAYIKGKRGGDETSHREAITLTQFDFDCRVRMECVWGEERQRWVQNGYGGAPNPRPLVFLQKQGGLLDGAGGTGAERGTQPAFNVPVRIAKGKCQGAVLRATGGAHLGLSAKSVTGCCKEVREK